VVDVDEVDVDEVDVDGLLVDEVGVWLPDPTVTVLVTVLTLVTVGVLVWTASGEGGLAGENSEAATEATPPATSTSPMVRPALSRFLRVTVALSAGAA